LPLVVIQRCSEAGHYLPGLRYVGEPINLGYEVRRLESQFTRGSESMIPRRPRNYVKFARSAYRSTRFRGSGTVAAGSW
jgi:hypothetical protein